MRKYTGKFPHAIHEISAAAPGTLLVKTNNGATYFLAPSDDPRLGQDIFELKFRRAQPMTFEQVATSFHRMLDGYAIPFVEYPRNISRHAHTNLDTMEKAVRRVFIQDMVRQNILPRITNGGSADPLHTEGTKT